MQDAIQPTAVGACAADDAASQATGRRQDSEFCVAINGPNVWNNLSGCGVLDSSLAEWRVLSAR